MKMIHCKRQDFIDFCNGDLMTNIGGTITHLGDAAHDAVEAVERGEDVVLTIAGKPVSKMVTIDGEHREVRIDSNV